MMIHPSAPSSRSARRGAVNKGCLIAIAATVVVALLFGAIGVGRYNSIVTLEEGTTAGWSEVENQYQRRFDLIPQLVSTVKGVANFESETLTAVTEARASVGQMQLPENFQKNQEQLDQFMGQQQTMGSALSRLLVVSERYPELRASQSFLSLQDQLEGTENRIAVARHDYIESVRSYNTYIRKFPNGIFATMGGFEKLPQFSVEEAAQQAPAIDFGD